MLSYQCNLVRLTQMMVSYSIQKTQLTPYENGSVYSDDSYHTDDCESIHSDDSDETVAYEITDNGGTNSNR